MRPDVYTTFHKGLRHALMNLQYMAGRADFTDDTEIQGVHKEMVKVWELLDYHADGEDELIHPHLKVADQSVFETLEAEHEELDKVEAGLIREIEDLEEMNAGKRAIAAIGFIKRLNDYIARYLLHTQREELEGMPALWEALDDEQIREINAEFPAKASPEVLQYFLKYMIPAINPEERSEILISLKAALPEPAFDNVKKLARSVLTEEEYVVLDNSITKTPVE